MEQIHCKIHCGSISNQPLQQLHTLRAGLQDWFKLFDCGFNIASIITTFRRSLRSLKVVPKGT
jgi:hypothetical protein